MSHLDEIAGARRRCPFGERPADLRNAQLRHGRSHDDGRHRRGGRHPTRPSWASMPWARTVATTWPTPEARAGGDAGDERPTSCWSAKPMQGMPEWVVGAELHYSGSPEVMAAHASRQRDAGIQIIGACCGSAPEHLAMMRQVLRRRDRGPRSRLRGGRQASRGKTARTARRSQAGRPRRRLVLTGRPTRSDHPRSDGPTEPCGTTRRRPFRRNGVTRPQ